MSTPDRPELSQPPVTLVLGEHFYARYTVRQDPGGPAAPVKDLTGITVKFALRDPASGAQIVKTSAPGVAVVDAVNGVVDAIVPNTETASLHEVPHRHELRLVEGGIERAAAAGAVNVVRLGF